MITKWFVPLFELKIAHYANHLLPIPSFVVVAMEAVEECKISRESNVDPVSSSSPMKNAEKANIRKTIPPTRVTMQHAQEWKTRQQTGNVEQKTNRSVLISSEPTGGHQVRRSQCKSCAQWCRPKSRLLREGTTRSANPYSKRERVDTHPQHLPWPPEQLLWAENGRPKLGGGESYCVGCGHTQNYPFRQKCERKCFEEKCRNKRNDSPSGRTEKVFMFVVTCVYSIIQRRNQKFFEGIIVGSRERKIFREIWGGGGAHYPILNKIDFSNLLIFKN